jgi:hypothetical protein
LDFDQDDEARSSFDQRCNEGPAGTLHEVALPMSWDRSIFYLGRPLADANRIDDPVAYTSIDCMAGAPDAPL